MSARSVSGREAAEFVATALRLIAVLGVATLGVLAARLALGPPLF